jgi:hypothetical protein
MQYEMGDFKIVSIVTKPGRPVISLAVIAAQEEMASGSTMLFHHLV